MWDSGIKFYCVDAKKKVVKCYKVVERSESDNLLHDSERSKQVHDKDFFRLVLTGRVAGRETCKTRGKLLEMTSESRCSVNFKTVRRRKD